MKLVRHIIYVVCILTVATSACLHGYQHVSPPQREYQLILICALGFLTAVGILGFITQFFERRTGQVLSSVFFGFLAGIMATNFISEFVAGTTYSSLTVYFISNGLMLLYFGLAVVGLVLFQISGSNVLQNQSPEPSAVGATGSAERSKLPVDVGSGHGH